MHLLVGHAAIDNGNRVVIGTALADIKGNHVSVNGFDVKVDDGDFNHGGLWACKQPGDHTNYCPEKPEAGHEVVVIGYDDGQKLLKIRNSWSSDAGDSGNFYMTYAFFNAMAMDQTVIK
jgi:C1A family cysteine protease